MLMGKVVGNVVSTRKNEKIIGSTILEIRLMENRQETDKYIIAIDSLGAGIGETVLVTTGSSARLALPNQQAPVDAVCPVHIRLNLEHKRREIFLKRIDLPDICFSRKRGGGHLQEMLQECLYSEICQC